MNIEYSNILAVNIFNENVVKRNRKARAKLIQKYYSIYLRHMEDK